MRTKIAYPLETIDHEIKKLIGEELYDTCKKLRDKPSELTGHQYTHFIKEKDGAVQYHLTRTACQKIHDYIFDNRDCILWNAYLGIDGYKLKFKVL